MPVFSKSTLPIALLAVAAASTFNTPVNAQSGNPATPAGAIGGETDTDSVWYGTGSESVIWVGSFKI